MDDARPKDEGSPRTPSERLPLPPNIAAAAEPKIPAVAEEWDERAFIIGGEAKREGALSGEGLDPAATGLARIPAPPLLPWC